jgi:hypothetical protein
MLAAGTCEGQFAIGGSMLFVEHVGSGEDSDTLIKLH